MPRAALTPSRFRRCTAFGAAVALAFLAAIPAAEALHRHTPPLIQVTSGSSSDLGGPSFIGTSNLLAFHSNADLLGNGNNTTNLFVFDLRYRVNKGEQGIYQVTTGPDAKRNPTAVRRASSLAFESDGDLLNNGSTGTEIFGSRGAKFRHGVVPLFQLTKSTGANTTPLLSGNGRYIAFGSTADLRGDGLGAGTHVYRAVFKNGFVGTDTCPSYPCTGNPGLDLVSTAAVGKFAIDTSGRYVVFDTTEDALGDDSDNGFRQVYLTEVDSGTTEALTNGSADSRNAVIERKGASIVFESDANILGTSSGHTQIFRWDRQKNPPVLEQLTFGTDGDSTSPSMTAKADQIVFSSTADLLGTNPSNSNQLFLYDVKTGQTVQLTSATENFTGAVNQLVFTVFESSANLVGNGNNQPQLFLINAYPLL